MIRPVEKRRVLLNIILGYQLFLEKQKYVELITIILALIFLCTVGFQQYQHLGRTKIDDVLCNAFDSSVGTLSYWVERKWL